VRTALAAAASPGRSPLRRRECSGAPAAAAATSVVAGDGAAASEDRHRGRRPPPSQSLAIMARAPPPQADAPQAAAPALCRHAGRAAVRRLCATPHFGLGECELRPNLRDELSSHERIPEMLSSSPEVILLKQQINPRPACSEMDPVQSDGSLSELTRTSRVCTMTCHPWNDPKNQSEQLVLSCNVRPCAA